MAEHNTNLAAPLTSMRLFARVDSCVNGQGGPLDELLATSRVITYVRLDLTMYPFCHRRKA